MGCRQCLPLSVVQQSLLSFVVVKIDQIEIVEKHVHLKKFPKLHNQLRERGETYIIDWRYDAMYFITQHSGYPCQGYKGGGGNLWHY